MYGLHESLILVKNEGLEAVWARHAAHHKTLHDGLTALGFEYLVAPEYRLPQLNAVIVPEQFKAEEGAIRGRLLAQHNLEIGGGLGALAGNVWRIGLMGYGASKTNVEICLNQLGALADPA